MKGVSAIIATILMLVITIGLAGTAYVYISGMLTGKTSKTISIIDATCDGATNTAQVVISNDGTQNILATELDDYVDTTNTNGCAGTAINSHTTAVCTITDAALSANAVHTILITSPTNSGRIQVQC